MGRGLNIAQRREAGWSLALEIGNVMFDGYLRSAEMVEDTKETLENLKKRGEWGK